MRHRTTLQVLRDHVIASEGQQSTPGLKAVEIERALERAGMTVVPVDIIAAFGAIVAFDGASPLQLHTLLVRLGLAKIVPFNPEAHVCSNEIEPGADFLEYGEALKAALKMSSPHLRGPLQ
jgi:hypothetical protein